MVDSADAERREAELALVQAMYPDQTTYDEKSSDFVYTEESGTLVLRLPSDYPSRSSPTVISAHLQSPGRDIREDIRRTIASLDADEETLDLIINAFRDSANQFSTSLPEPEPGPQALSTQQTTAESATVIIWLHHLLATEKRKLAIRPPDARVAGISKPGYPGVMIFSGPASAVQAHVAELRSLNWQAFQVRYEGDEDWRFSHGKGVKEVESMGEVTQEIGEERKGVFLEAMRMKV